ncbi:MAG: hypothetical protein KDD70_04435 [Bdellovibrionales bacterium]|nr:hypothetical protein [Bdellovibrionales bacterium]
MSGEREDGFGDGEFLPWNPHQDLPVVEQVELEFSRGFMRCKPELWFPGFAAHWLPLLHTLGLQVEVQSVRPKLDLQREPLDTSGAQTFVGTINGEPLALIIPTDTFEFISRVQVPGGNLTAKHLVVEYFSRRFLTSLVHSWSANEDGEFRLESEMTVAPKQFLGGVEIVFRVNGELCEVLVALGRGLLDRLDQLWISQVTQGSGVASGAFPLKLVLGHSFVSPSELEDTLVVGKSLPIEIGGTEECFLYLNEEPWMQGRLCAKAQGLSGAEDPIAGGDSLVEEQGTKEGELLFQTSREVMDRHAGPPGTTQLSFELGSSHINKLEMMLLSQGNALYELPHIDPRQVHILIGGQKAASGELVSYDSQVFVRVHRIPS